MSFLHNVKNGLRLIFSHKGLEIFMKYVFILVSLIAIFLVGGALLITFLMPTLFLPTMIFTIFTEGNPKNMINLIILIIFFTSALAVLFVHFFVKGGRVKSLAEGVIEGLSDEMGTILLLSTPLWLIQLYYIFEYFVGSILALATLKYFSILLIVVLTVYSLYRLGKNNS